jgi:ribosomal protein S18 acetylase RimI-like enzyme
MDVTVRLARPSDAEAVLVFGAEVIPAHYTPILGADAAQGQLRWWTSERMAAAIKSGRVHLAVDGEEIAGVCETGEFDGQQVIWKLYIAPQARNRGIGVTLLTRAVAALPAGTKHVIVEHFAGNTRAAAFYDREGFDVVRTDAAASGDPAADVVWRSRDLRAMST